MSARVSIPRVRVALAVLLAAGCVDPEGRRPGLRLAGEVVSGPVDDWSFTDDHKQIFLETRTPYLLPHSMTIYCAALDGRLYIGARRPAEKRWVDYVERDPRVRLAVAGEIYERRLERVEDPAEREAIFRAYAANYGWDPVPEPDRPEVRYFRVIERDPPAGTGGA